MALSLQNRTVCIIEDNDIIRKLFALLLEDKVETLISFETGESAMSWLASNKVDIVLCDIVLPDVGGGEILKAVRLLPGGQDIKVVALTAVARQGDREKFLAEGFDGYISKPINPSTFAAQIEALVQSS